MDPNSIYSPMTIVQLIKNLAGMVKQSEDLTGDELIVGAYFVGENNRNVPPGSVAFQLMTEWPNRGFGSVGTLVITPGPATKLM